MKRSDCDMLISGRRELLHLADGQEMPVEADEIVLLEAVSAAFGE
jgi:hypothetical protein